MDVKAVPQLMDGFIISIYVLVTTRLLSCNKNEKREPDSMSNSAQFYLQPSKAKNILKDERAPGAPMDKRSHRCGEREKRSGWRDTYNEHNDPAQV